LVFCDIKYINPNVSYLSILSCHMTLVESNHRLYFSFVSMRINRTFLFISVHFGSINQNFDVRAFYYRMVLYIKKNIYILCLLKKRRRMNILFVFVLLSLFVFFLFFSLYFCLKIICIFVCVCVLVSCTSFFLSVYKTSKELNGAKYDFAKKKIIDVCYSVVVSKP